MQFTFNLGPEIIKEICEFKFYFNKTNVKPAMLDMADSKLFLANWTSYRKIMCAHNNNIPDKHTQPPICADEQESYYATVIWKLSETFF